MFNWKEATIEQCAKQVLVATTQSVSSVYGYYRRTDNVEMLEKIDKARTLAIQFRKLKEAEYIKRTLLKEGYQIADYNPITNQGVDK